LSGYIYVDTLIFNWYS